MCYDPNTVRRGYLSTLTFLTQPDTITTDDELFFSVASDATTNSCATTLLVDFPAGRAVVSDRTRTNISFVVEWPVSLSNSQYTACYLHNGTFYRVCPCSIVNVHGKSCNMTISPAVPSSFTYSPVLAHVGQMISITINSSRPITEVKLVVQGDALTTCSGLVEYRAAVPASLIHPGVYQVGFKSLYLDQPVTLLVCALLERESTFVRVPSDVFNHVLVLHPYLSLSTFPSGELLRAFHTVNVSIVHLDKRNNFSDVINDIFTFVTSPEDCIEGVADQRSYLEKIVDLLELNDTSFKSLPAVPQTTTRTSVHTTVTFKTAIPSAIFVCYKISGGTWAVVNEGFVVGAPFIPDNCYATSHVSLYNGLPATSRNIFALEYSLFIANTTQLNSFSLDGKVIVVRSRCHLEFFRGAASLRSASNVACCRQREVQTMFSLAQHDVQSLVPWNCGAGPSVPWLPCSWLPVRWPVTGSLFQRIRWDFFDQ